MTALSEYYLNPRYPKLFVYDLEIGTMVGTSYNTYDTTILDVLQSKYILCFSYAWYDFANPTKKPKVHSVSLADFPARFKDNPFDDEDVVRALHRLMIEADWLSAYNGKRFDDKMANTRFAKYGLDFIDDVNVKMIDPFRTIKRTMALEKNNLDYVNKFFGHKGKAKVTHSDVRLECTQVENWWHHRPIEIDTKAWRLMTKYCEQDVVAAYQAYTDTRHMDRTHPNISMYMMNDGCPRCGSTKLRSERIRTTQTMTYRQWVCENCKARPRERIAEKDLYRPDFVN